MGTQERVCPHSASKEGVSVLRNTVGIFFLPPILPKVQYRAIRAQESPYSSHSEGRLLCWEVHAWLIWRPSPGSNAAAHA